MANLRKKFLSLVLTLSFVLSLSVIPVGATTFTDENDIQCMDAVQMLTALGIIVGNPDGSFAPNDSVTRAQMAKMIYVLRNSGVDDGAKGYPASGLTDINGHWAEGYINACYSAGIIAGVGGNRFDPDSSVTGIQVYKMLLTVIGYDQNRAGLVGPTWAQNTMKLASETGITEDVTCSLSEAMPRQFAAQAIYNAIDANRVKLDDGEYVEYSTTDADPTVGEKYMGLKTAEGIYVGNDEFSLDGTSISDGYIKIAVVEDGQETGAVLRIKSDADISLIGQQVKVQYKTNSNSSTNVAYGMYATGDSELENFKTVDGYDADDLKNKASADAPVYVNCRLFEPDVDQNGDIDDDDEESWTIDYLAETSYPDGTRILPKGYSLTIIYNDLTDDEGDPSEYTSLAFVTAVSLNEITTYSGSTLTFSDAIPTDNFADTDDDPMDKEKSFDLDDQTITYDLPEDVEEGDIVYAWYNPVGDVLHAAKAEYISGEVTGVTSDGDKIRMDDTYYSYSDLGEFSPYASDNSDFTDPEDINTGNDYNLYLLNGFYVAAGKTSGTGSGNDDDFAAIDGAYTVGEELRLKLVTADGSTVTYNVNEFLDVDVDDMSSAELEDIRDAFIDEDTDEIKIKLVTYEIKSNGVNILAVSSLDELRDIDDFDDDDYLIEDLYEVTIDGDDNDLFYKESTGVITNSEFTAVDGVADALSGSQYIATDATIFFDDGDLDAYYFSSLDDDVDWGDIGDGATVYIALNDDDDIGCLCVTGSDWAPSAVSGMSYGYLLREPADNGDNVEFYLWTVNGAETYEYDGSLSTVTSDGILKHSVVAFTLDASDMIDDLYLVMQDDLSDKKDFRDYDIGFGEITDVDGSRIKIVSTEDYTVSCKTTDDSYLMTIDSDNTKGVDGTTKLRKNNQCIYVINDDAEIEFVVIDTNGYFKKGSAFERANNGIDTDFRVDD